MDLSKIMQAMFTGADIGEALLKDGRLLSSPVALAAFFSRRFSSQDSYEHRFDSLVFKTQKDFPLLQNRETVRFYSADHYLYGYIYRSSLSKGLVLFVHGIKGQADDAYAIGENALLEAGYDVFAIDLSASGRSEPNGIKGLHQGALDVKAAIDFICTRDDLKNLPLFLFGHSWGAYSCLASTNFITPVKKVVAISGFSTPIEEMVALPESKTGMELSANRPDLEAAMLDRCGPQYDLSALTGMKNNPQIKYLLIQGALDNVVPLKASAYEKGKSFPNVTSFLVENKGHADILFSEEASQYQKQIEIGKRQVEKEYGKDILTYPPELLDSLKYNIDKQKASQIDAKLFETVDEFFQSK